MPRPNAARVRPFHPPGIKTKREFFGYNETADIKQRIFSDAMYAAAFGFGACRVPTPGAVLPEDDVNQRLTHIAEGWAYETELRGKDRTAFDPRLHLSPLHQYHLAEAMMPYPQTDRPWDRKPLQAADDEGE